MSSAPDLAAQALAALRDADYERGSDIVDFDGPPLAYFGTYRYTTLTSFGVKGEGEAVYPDTETRLWTEAEAVWRFKREFVRYVTAQEGSQLAWRLRPKVETGADGDFYVIARFVVMLAIHDTQRAEKQHA